MTRLLYFVVGLCWCVSSVAGGGPDALSILLTNDDGYDAPGIKAMRSALTAAGHHVMVVSARDQRSGSSVKITPGGTTYEQLADDLWVIDASPADAVLFGLAYPGPGLWPLASSR